MKIEIRGLEDLSFRERQAVILKETGRSNASIASQMGISEATVATLLHRARVKGYEVVAVLPGSAVGLAGEESGVAEDGDDGSDAQAH